MSLKSEIYWHCIIIETIFSKLYYKTLQTMKYMNYNFLQKNPYKTILTSVSTLITLISHLKLYIRITVKSQLTVQDWCAICGQPYAPEVSVICSYSFSPFPMVGQLGPINHFQKGLFWHIWIGPNSYFKLTSTKP